MKRYILFLIAVLTLPVVLMAQGVDDDMYFVPSKKKAAKQTTVLSSATSSTSRMPQYKADADDSAWDDAEADADYHTGTLRDVDDYNRRGTASKPIARLVGDTLYVTTDSLEENSYVLERDYDTYQDDQGYYDDDFHFTSRLHRYHGL